MGFKVTYNDVTYEVETMEQALKLGSKLGQGSRHGGLKNGSGDYADFWQLLKANQRAALKAMLSADTMMDDQLAQALKIKNNKGLGGLLSGLGKNARKTGHSPNEIYIMKKTATGREYRLADQFREALKKLK